jgi:predicted cupin superfamily sugar epimerase
MTAEEIKKLLKLEPHPVEGGSFRQTYICGATVKLARGVRAAG